MPESRCRKGQLITFRLGTRTVQGQIKEDRGPIGVNGRHLYLVEFQADPDSASQIELPADQIQPVDEAVSAR
jgi:hypothetical protein